jgi:parallel beta-helix repeat protein
VLGVYNTRTQESFATIQEAVDDPDTKDGDIITLAEGIYTENVAINKKLSIQPVTGANVIIKAKDFDVSVIAVISTGSGTTIQGLNIIGAGSSYGISLSHAYNCLISNNIISSNNRDIYLYCSGNNNITGNTLRSSFYGIYLYKSTNNKITNNIITKNENAVSLLASNYNSITGNQITDNYYGSYIYHSNNIDITENNIKSNWVGVYLYDTNSNSVTENDFIDNGAGITYHNSIGLLLSGNNFTDNWLADMSVINSSEVVMATSIYTCGPAALATILKRLGIYVTEAELAQIAGTDYTGTSLLGLKNAASAMGINAFGYELSIEQLKPNYIVVLRIDGYDHFVVLENITADTVTLFDPNLGIIEMDLNTFNDLYTGYAFVLNETIPGAVQLTDDQMSNIKGMWHTVRTIKWRWHPPEIKTYTISINISIPYPVVLWSYHRGWNIWTPWGPREIGGFWYPSGYKIEYYHIRKTIIIPYLVPGYFEPYAAYVREADASDLNYNNFLAATFTLAGAGYFGVQITGTVLISGLGASITSDAIAGGVFSGAGIYTTYFTEIVNPDPNPTGAGEGYVNMIDPSMEWMVSS